MTVLGSIMYIVGTVLVFAGVASLLWGAVLFCFASVCAGVMLRWTGDAMADIWRHRDA
jgi:hypothetical protein